MRVVEFVLDGLRDDVVSTKRDLYYRDVSLFISQTTVDSILEDLAATLAVRRSDLNIVATSKGLFSGPLTLHLNDGSQKKGSVEGTLIPPSRSIERINASEVAWVLVVEKDAVFRTLSAVHWSSESIRLSGGVLITGKGYPDVSTRELLKRLADGFPSVPILFLVDADPHGIEILCTYALGSTALSYDSSNLAIGHERARWIGLRPTNLDPTSAMGTELLELSARDRKKALKMSNREWLPSDWRLELSHMLELDRKAEIEILSSSTSSFSLSQSGFSSSTTSGPSATSPLVNFVLAEIRKALTTANELA